MRSAWLPVAAVMAASLIGAARQGTSGYYPDENHRILTRENSVHWYGELRDWMKRFAAPGPRQ